MPGNEGTSRRGQAASGRTKLRGQSVRVACTTRRPKPRQPLPSTFRTSQAAARSLSTDLTVRSAAQTRSTGPTQIHHATRVTDRGGTEPATRSEVRYSEPNTSTVWSHGHGSGSSGYSDGRKPVGGGSLRPPRD